MNIKTRSSCTLGCIVRGDSYMKSRAFFMCLLHVLTNKSIDDDPYFTKSLTSKTLATLDNSLVPHV